jgi:hypothetical protein
MVGCPAAAKASHQRIDISSSTAPSLLKLLKAYKRSITIGVVGYPNVGKSSLIKKKGAKYDCFFSYRNIFFPNGFDVRYVLSQPSQAIRKTGNRSNLSVECVSLTLLKSFLTTMTTMTAKEARKVVWCFVMSSRWKMSRTR